MTENAPQPAPAAPHRRLRRILLWAGSILAIVVVAALVTGDILLHRAGPILKDKVIDTLSTRFDSRVDLKTFQVSLVRGFEVYGSGLKLYPNHLDASQPLIQVDRFSFHVFGWRSLFHTPFVINRVQVSGLSIDMPPKQQRHDLPHFSGGGAPGVDESHNGIKVLVGEIVVDHADLVIENGKPGKIPLNFTIHKLVLTSVGPGRPMKFHATLVNPKPVGDIDSTGDFGPFNADSPGDSPVDGHYSFSHADLNPIKGIGGMLASTGDYRGQLDSIDVTGETTTPNFSLDTANRPVPLNTKFHAIVDGLNGDTHLQPVDAWLAQTHIVARGDVIRNPKGPGHIIHLDATVGPGRIEDILTLATKSDRPLMSGQIRLQTTVDIPPDPVRVVEKLRLKGAFAVLNAHFNNDKIQAAVDQLSLRGQGKPGAAKREQTAMKAGNSDGGTAADVASQMGGNFTFGDSTLTLTSLNYQVPGADIAISGNYKLQSELLDFHGVARLNAHLSQMVGGWKGFLLKPVDPFFAKDGAGTQVPIRITGSRSDPKIGLDFGHKR